jgi:hypothetical protein
MLIFDADNSLVLDGTYDREGYQPGERARIAKARRRDVRDGVRCALCLCLLPGHYAGCATNCDSPSAITKGPSMRLFDTDRVGCYLDGVNLRLEKTKDNEHKVIDLTLRVQPFTPELANALHPDVRALLFTMNSATPKPLLKAVALNLADVPTQHIDAFLLPEETDAAGFTLMDAEIGDLRVRTEKSVDGYALIFYATIGPVGKDELEYVTNWYTQARFLTFREAQATMDFSAKAEGDTEPRAPRRGRRAKAGKAPK